MNDRPDQTDQASEAAPTPTPASDDAVDIAMEADQHDPAMDSSARVLLAKQARLVDADLAYRKLQTASERVSFLLKALTVFAGVAFAAALLSIAVSAARSSAVVVEVFETPPALAERGLSGRVVAAGIQDGLSKIQSSVRSTAQRRNIANAWTGDISVEVASTGISIGEIDRILRRSLGNETYIGGDIVQTEDGSLLLTVRGPDTPPRTFTAPASEFANLMTQGAEYIYGVAEPRLFGTYLLQRRRYAEGSRFLAEALGRADEETRPELLMLQGLHVLASDRVDPAVGRRGAMFLRQALAEDPYLWRGWNALVAVAGRLEGEEAAWRVGQQMIALNAAARPRNKTQPGYWFNYQILVEDWTGQIADTAADSQASGGGSFSVLNSTFQADAEARRHDWAKAEQHLEFADPDDTSLVPTRLFLEGFNALNEGRPADAIAPLEALHTLWQASPDLQFQFIRAPCYLAAAYGLTGKRTEAEALFARVGRRVVCVTLQAVVSEATDDRAEADAAWQRAINLAPSLPTAYQYHGLALLGRGDLAAAGAAFDLAHSRGPRWADPIKGQGDVLARRGRWREAAARYHAALEFAPGWPQLIAASRMAHKRAGLAWAGE